MKRGNQGALSGLPQRVIIYTLGMFFIALGVALAVNSNLGISTVSSLPYVISIVLRQPLSLCVTGVFCCAVLLQIIILRRQFKPIQLTQIIFSALFGLLVDFSGLLLGEFCLPGYLGRLIMTLAGVLMIALGVTIYVEAALVPMPMEGLSLAIAQKSKYPFHRVKVVVDCSLVGIGIILSLCALGRIEGIREGTIISAVLAGPLIPIFRRPIKPIIDRFCFPKCITSAPR